MNQKLLTSILALALVAVAGAAIWLMAGQQDLESQIDLKETEVANSEATLVQVFAQQRESDQASDSAIATVGAELNALRAQATDVAPILATQEAIAQLPTLPPVPSVAVDVDTAPQVRIRLARQEPVRVVGEEVEIIVSASHSVGIAAVNVLVNDELLLEGNPFDPRMEISLASWTPLEAGTYEIKAIATTVRGRTSDPVILEIEVLETDNPDLILQTQLRRIERDVQEIRGLEQQGEININLIDRNNLRENVGTDLLGEFTREDAERDTLVLSSFNFMPRDYPLYDSLVELYGFVVAGYYDEETNSLYVISDDNQLDDEEKLTHAHEYMHALQDQYFSLADVQNGSLNADETMALRALAEGEASLVEFVYRTRGYLTGEQGADNNPVQTVPESIPAPNILANQLAFPYVRGQEFLANIFEQEGFEGINQIWENPPRSTEQILHFDRYAAGDRPILVELPSDQILTELGDGWEQIADDVFGEFNVIEYLSLTLPEDAVNPAALGWGGDRYGVYYNRDKDERVMVLKMVWDTAEDQVEFVNAKLTWAEQLLGRELSDTSEGMTCWENGPDDQCLIVLENSIIITRADSTPLRQTINKMMQP